MGIRVLHAISVPAAGGAETYVKNVALELKRRGHQPAIAFMQSATEAGRSEEFERSFLAELDAAEVDHFFLGASRKRSYPRAARLVSAYCRTNGVQIYHSHLKPAILTGALLGIPHVHTHHTSTPRAPRWAYRLFNRLVDHWIGISAVCGDLLHSYTGREVSVVHNAVNATDFVPRVREPRPGGSLSCIAVGRIFEPKNYPLLIAAMALVPAAMRQRLRLTIVGEGTPERTAELERQISGRGLQGLITLAGNRLDVPALLDGADLFLMSSSREGFPISLLEATASGLPFIATDVGACRELAERYGNGVIVPAGDARALAEAVTQLADDPQRLSLLSQAAVDNARGLSVETSVTKLVEIYEQLLD